MLFSLVIVYIGPFLGTCIDNANNRIDIKQGSNNRKVYWLCGAGLLGSFALVILGFSNEIWATMVAVILLGFCNAIVYSAQGSYALELPAAHIIGSGRTVSIYNTAERLGQVIGPIGFGLAISIFGVQYSLQMFAMIFALMSCMLLFTAKSKVHRIK